MLLNVMLNRRTVSYEAKPAYTRPLGGQPALEGG